MEEEAGTKPNHRRSLLAISSLAIVYQLGWLQGSSIASLQISIEKLQWVIGALLVYFFVVYHQRTPLRDTLGWRLRRPVEERLSRTVFERAQAKARRDARPEEKEVSFIGPAKPPPWPIAPREWELSFRVGRELNDPNSKGVLVRVGNPLRVRSLRAWAHLVVMTPFAMENWFPTVWSCVAALMFVPAIREWVRSILQ